VKPHRTIAQVLADTGPILLDFDGPICDLFATTPAAHVADQLRQVLTNNGIVLPRHIADHADPLEVLRHTATLDNPTLTAKVDDALRQAERHAINGSTPTPYAREVIVAAHHAGRPLAIVSNNSEPAIHAYLTKHRLALYISHISSRPYADPARMKPNPQPILEAVAALDAKPATCVLIGDSANDLEASRAAGVHTIGYVNKPDKQDRMTAAGADAMISGEEGAAQLARVLHAEAQGTQ
jgi:HAD superfamily hydrolase (TIGR01509 family)